MNASLQIYVQSMTDPVNRHQIDLPWVNGLTHSEHQALDSYHSLTVSEISFCNIIITIKVEVHKTMWMLGKISDFERD